MQKKVLIISMNDYNKPYMVYPLATAYLKSYILNFIKNCEVAILDINFTKLDKIAEFIKNLNPDFILMSMRNIDPIDSTFEGNFLNKYKKIMGIVRENSKSKVIIGGSGFSIFPNEVIKELKPDFAIAGEGEYKLVDLLKKLIENNPNQKIETLHNPQHNSCIDYKDISLNYEENLVNFYWENSGVLNIQTKRGCPFSCIYCTYPKIDGNCIRTLNIDSIINSIAKLKKDNNVSYFFFTDSVFNVKRNYNLQLAQAMIDAKLDVSWSAYFTPKNISDEEMQLYKAAGLSHIEFGSESFCDESLQNYNKNFTFPDVLKSSELALKYNIFYSHFVILGGYKDNKKQIETTIKNSEYLKRTVIFAQEGMRINPNTALQEIAIKEGIIAKEDNLLEPKFYFAKDYDKDLTRKKAIETKKAWIFSDTNEDNKISVLRKRHKKGPLWEYLRKA